jgi:hypothetical protein
VSSSPVGSTGRCNTGVKSLRWDFAYQSLTWPFVELTSHFLQMSLRMHRQVDPLREVLPEQTIGVFIGGALPRTLRICSDIMLRRRERREGPKVAAPQTQLDRLGGENGGQCFKSPAICIQRDAPLLGARWTRCGLTTSKRRGRLGAFDAAARQRMTLPARRSGRTSSASIGAAK